MADSVNTPRDCVPNNGMESMVVEKLNTNK